MQKSLTDIESFDEKVNQIFREAEVNRSRLFDINETGKQLGLNNEEIETIEYHLKRSNMVESAKGSLLRVSKYGHMLYKGQINYGYAPI